MRYLIYLTLLVAMPLSAGSIHKWVDEDGNVHYGDAPPVTVKTENVRVQSAPSNPGKALPRLAQPETQQDTDTGTDTGTGTGTASGDATPQDVPADQAKVACDNAQEDLKIISSSSRIKLRLADGSTRYMTTEEINERKTAAEADIARFCE